MAFHEKEVPANASVGEKVLAWVDSRLPVTEAFKRHMSCLLYTSDAADE